MATVVNVGKVDEPAVVVPFGTTFTRQYLFPGVTCTPSADKVQFVVRDLKGVVQVSKNLTPVSNDDLNCIGVTVTLTSAELDDLAVGTYKYGLALYEDYANNAGEPVTPLIASESFMVVTNEARFDPAS